MFSAPQTKLSNRKKSGSFFPCLHFANPVLLGGVGDIILSILVLMIRAEAEKFPIRTVFVSTSQASKVRSLMTIMALRLPRLAHTLEGVDITEIQDDLLKEITKRLQDYAPQGNIWGPRLFICNQIEDPLFSVWPGASSNLGDVLETSASWSSSYIRYSIDTEAVGEVFEVDSTLMANPSFDTAFISLTANSFSVNQLELVTALSQVFESLRISLNRIIYNTITIPQERPDIVHRPGEHGNIDTNHITQLSQYAEKWLSVTDVPFMQMVALIEESDILIAFRSGITDLAALLGKKLITIYPSMQEFSWFKVSSQEKIVSTQGQYVITYCSPSFSIDSLPKITCF